MTDEIRKYLLDIQESINSIFDYLGSKRDFKEYCSNKQLRRAVEREFEIIGEAMNRIRKIEPQPSITNAKKIIELRNWVIHGYDRVDDVIIWGIISKHLPLLKTEIDNLLELPS